MNLDSRITSLKRNTLITSVLLACAFVVCALYLWTAVYRSYPKTLLHNVSRSLEEFLQEASNKDNFAFQGMVAKDLSSDLVVEKSGLDLKMFERRGQPEKILDPQGIFVEGNSAKFLFRQESGFLLVEVSEAFFSKIFYDDVFSFALTDEDGYVLLSTVPELIGKKLKTDQMFINLSGNLKSIEWQYSDLMGGYIGAFIPISFYVKSFLPILLVCISSFLAIWISFSRNESFLKNMKSAFSVVSKSVWFSVKEAENDREANFVPVKTTFDEFNELQSAISRLVQLEKASQMELHAMLNSLQDSVDELENAQKTLQERNLQIISTLAEAIEIKDTSTYGHSRKMAELALSLAQELGITDPADLEAIRFGALLHDVGKIGIPEHILNKPGRLTVEEFEIMKLHTVYGERIVRNISGWDLVADIVRHHHENVDGSGYPDGLLGDEISIRAQIVAIVDVFTALTEERPYRNALSKEEALRIMENEMVGKKFTRSLWQAFLKVLK